MKEKIGLVGPGKLGLCVGLLLERSGFEVTAVESNLDYLTELQNKSLESPEPEVSSMLSESSIVFTSNLSVLIEGGCRTILLYVPTPDSQEGYDHSILEKVLNQFMSFGFQKEPITVMVGCTTLPGFCDSYSSALVELNFNLVYSPSFIAQGNIIQNLQQPDILLFGTEYPEATKTCRRVMSSISSNDPMVHEMDIKSAEITKLATNCFLTAKIAFANAIGDLAVKTGADQEAILNAVGNDSRIGNSYLRYGFGFGGPCFPRDNRALKHFADKNDFDLLISDATEKANDAHSSFQLDQFLNDNDPDEIIHFDHVSYKPDSDILEESQQLKLALSLARNGRKVSVGGSSEVIRKLKESYGELFLYDSKNK